MTTPPCKNCDKRSEIVEKYGNCHNEHCPYGWNEFQDYKRREYDRKARVNDASRPTVGYSTQAHKTFMSKKKGR